MREREAQWTRVFGDEGGKSRLTRARERDNAV